MTATQGDINLAAVMDLAEQDRVHIRPGMEFTSPGDLTLPGAQDFLGDYFLDPVPFAAQVRRPAENLGWRYTVNRIDASGNPYQYSEPGIVSFAAAGNIVANESISDGVVSVKVPFSLVSGISVNQLLPTQPLSADIQGLETWSYRYIAGYDTQAASLFSVSKGSGSFNLANGRYIRTGTGNIDIIAGKDIVLGEKSSIYTVGQSTGRGSFGTVETVFGFPFSVMDELVLPGVEYPDTGGDIKLLAGGNISANPASLYVNDWLHRISLGEAGNRLTTWGVRIESFQDGIAALGGGDISISAEGDISNLGVSIPTTGKQLADVSFDSSSLKLGFAANSVIEVNGRGDISLTAGGDLIQSVFCAGNGDINVDVFGSIGKAHSNSGLLIIAENTQASINANGDINLQGVVNPGLLPGSSLQPLATDIAYFSTYNESTGINLLSLGGDINLRNRVDLDSSVYATLLLGFNAESGRDEIARRYPASLSVIAMSGNINFGNSQQINNNFGQFLSLMPAAQGSLNLLADKSILALNQQPASNSRLFMMDVEPASIADIYNPVDVLSLPDFTGAGLVERASIPVHINDTGTARIIANTGDIASLNSGGQGFRVDIPTITCSNKSGRTNTVSTGS